MNLRILKKLSKRAADLLPLVGCRLEPFAAERWENYHTTCGMDRKHHDRSRTVHAEPWGRERIIKPRYGQHYVAMREPSHPLKGTMMVGAMDGYYEPEWEEEDAWASLRSSVREHFTDYKNYDEATMNWPKCLRRLQNPSAVFKAVPELIAKHQKEEAERRERDEKWKAEVAARRAAREAEVQP